MLYFYVVLFACVVGWVKAGKEMNAVKKDPSLGVPPSKNIFTFLFTDPY
jgi:hypothetical protein